MMILDLVFVFCFSFAALFTLHKLAPSLGLIDKPNVRKQHQGAIPLVGGIAIFSTVAFYLNNHPTILLHSDLFLVCTAILIVLGALDDRFDLSVKLRLAVQAAVTIGLMYFTGMELNYIGNILGLGELSFGLFAPAVTIFAVIGAINAFNMVDGIDGLLGGLTITTLTAIAVILNIHNLHNLASFCVLLIVAVIPFILMNTGLLGHKRKIFMGDAGSMVIGFTVIWLLLLSTQPPETAVIRPVTALWLIALPLMDMTAIMLRRYRNGKSPFMPDRDHLHHICLNAGFSASSTLFVICAVAASLATFGIIGEYFLIPEWFMFTSFLVTFAVYNYGLQKNWPKQIADIVEEAVPSNLVLFERQSQSHSQRAQSDNATPETSIQAMKSKKQ
ncbi:MAG: UDP-N-acetylglucosamine--undecaprenyl-phosphate N-acetylglucosaminephosphotransferase [Glaciecola sp.]